MNYSNQKMVASVCLYYSSSFFLFNAYRFFMYNDKHLYYACKYNNYIDKYLSDVYRYI